MTSAFEVGHRLIGARDRVYVIAEAGSNHDGSLDRAFELIDIAATAGADAIKFQLFQADKIAAQTAHPIATLDNGTDLHRLYGKHETPRHWLKELVARCEQRRITFLATPFDEGAADALQSVAAEAYKIASFELVHLPLLRHVARFGKPLILSTGMATLGEIEEAIVTIESEGNNSIALLHCGIGYPFDPGDVHLRAMQTMAAAFPYPVGYSDHTDGIAVPLAVAAMGGAVIEKHFTYDKKATGPDHHFAIDPEELRAMVSGIRVVERALGQPRKGPSGSEMIHLQRGRRSLFFTRDLEESHRLRPEDLAVLRPGVGLHPRYHEVIVGRRLQSPVRAHQPVSWDDF
jgi:N-acetylneuraminate synthase/N,N'-diacetyllegionaminate synthase